MIPAGISKARPTIAPTNVHTVTSTSFTGDGPKTDPSGENNMPTATPRMIAATPIAISHAKRLI